MSEQTGTGASLETTLDYANAVVRRALDYAAASATPVAAVFVDAAGHPVAGQRMDGAPFVVFGLAQEKAWTAAAFGTPTKTWGESSRPEGPYWGLTNALGGRFSVLAGGAPLLVDGVLLGAVGVSGGDDKFDHDCAVQAAALGSSGS